jgi:phospholipid/cholesterol/gamma-HCH transport system permease protein
MRHARETPSEKTAIAVTGDGERIALEGALDIHTLDEARTAIGKTQSRVVDLAGLSALDTPGALMLCGLGSKVELTGAHPDHQAILDLVCGLDHKPLPKAPLVARWREILIQAGRSAHEAGEDLLDLIAFVGRVASAVAGALLSPSRLRPASISRQVRETGIEALPIVGLLAVMIATVVAYQGVVQLRPFGGEDFTINLVAVSVLREMGVLITAIIVAGRSGSAFTAEIGVMKAREEIDALEAMGLDPMDLLVVPRILGLVIALPLLTFFADAMGLAGGAVITHVILGISPEQYLAHAREALDASDLFVGLFKAPIFAVVIAVVGCMHGLRVHGSAESVGTETTRSVVKSIFLVIVLDALFSIFFEKVGW